MSVLKDHSVKQHNDDTKLCHVGCNLFSIETQNLWYQMFFLMSGMIGSL